MLLHELNNTAYHGHQVGYPSFGQFHNQGNMHRSMGFQGYAAPREGRMLYDGLGNPVGILPFIAALAPLAMKALAVLPSIAGKAATLLPQITSAASTVMPAISTPAVTPQQAMPSMPMPSMPPPTMTMQPMHMPAGQLALETVIVPMRENDGRLVMVRRRLIRRGRRKRSPVSATAMVERLPAQQQLRTLQGWFGRSTRWI
jgi:hypothetical protein